MPFLRLFSACAALSFALLATFPAVAATQRYEADSLAADASDACWGYNPSAWSSTAEAGASSGGRLTTTQAGAVARVVFGGTGVELVFRRAPGAGTIAWSLDDGAQTGQIDQSGSAQAQALAVIAAAGSLPNALHTLELTCSTPGAAGVSLDAINVHNAQRVRIEQDQIPPFAYTNWQDPSFADAGALPSGGTLGYADSAGAEATFRFSGRSVAVIEYRRGDYGRYAWSIDDGARTGTVDLSQTSEGGMQVRWPRVLATDLAAAPHTLRITALDNKLIVLDAVDVSNNGLPLVTGWTSERGLYVFSNFGYLDPWAPRNWSLAQWDAYNRGLLQMGINHLQLPRAPWSERPAQTSAETANQEHWKGILQNAKAIGMRTSLIFQMSGSGTTLQPWTMRSPNNSTTSNWARLTSDYAQWSSIYGTLVDEWHTGAEDPGGCPVCADKGWSAVSSTPQCNPANPVCTIQDYVDLLNAARNAVQMVNPSARVVAHSWGLPWWGKDPGYATQLASFVAKAPTLAPDITLSAVGLDDPQTDALQSTGRFTEAWPFYLLGHEFTAGLTKFHPSWIRSYLKNLKDQGMTKIITHISQPIEMLPAVFYYAKLLEDNTRTDTSIMREFAAHLVESTADRDSLAEAILRLAAYWDSISAAASWEIETMRPINNTPPYAKRYNATQLGHLDTAVARLNSITTPRAVPTLSMVIPPAEWIEMLRQQATVLRDAARMDEAIAESGAWLDAHHAELAALGEPISRSDAAAWEAQFATVGVPGRIARIRDYLARFLVNYTGTPNPLGEIYDYFLTFLPAQHGADTLGRAGDYLEVNAPSHGRLLIHMDGTIDDLDTNFCWVNLGSWTRVSDAAFHQGSAMQTTTANAEARILFAGSGVSLLHSRWGTATQASWAIEGTPHSGTIDMSQATRQDQVSTPLASGLPDGLYVLTIRHIGTAGRPVLIDGIVVERNARWRIEESRTDFTFSAGDWATSSDAVYAAGSQKYTTVIGATGTVAFEGRGLALTLSRRNDYGTLAWSIDGGAGGSGTINLGAAQSFRYPVVLANDLSDGPHTLTLTHQSGFLSNIDGIDTWRMLPVQAAAGAGWSSLN